LVFGLGNPGPRYQRTRHNVGWRVVERVVERWRAAPYEQTPRLRAWRAETPDGEAFLVEPLTFMNLSGEALIEWRERHGLDPGALLVITDDVYLPLGWIRMRARGSSGGHRGLESVEEVLGAREYARLRIGIGAVESAGLREHVLEEPAEDEEKLLEDALGRAADAVECWAREGVLAAMSRFNRRVRKEVSES
jgi:PTH1 family peptidyl-tRNA hydrolase